MVRMHKAHQPQRPSLSPLDSYILRIKSPRPGKSQPRRLTAAFPPTKLKHSKAGFCESPLQFKLHQSRREILVNDSPALEDSDSEEELFQWEEEETLVNALIQNGSFAQTENLGLMSLIDSLQPSFTARGTKVLHDLADNLVPAARCVKAVHGAYERDVDRVYAQGLLLFDDACHTEEVTITAEEEQIKTAHQEAKDKITQLFRELAELYSQRDQLWQSLSDAIQGAGDCSKY